MAIEIVSVPIRHGDFPVCYVSHNQRVAESSGHGNEAFQRTLASSQLSGIQVGPENSQVTAGHVARPSVPWKWLGNP